MKLINVSNFLKQFSDQVPGDKIDAIELRLALLDEPTVEAIPKEWIKAQLEKEEYRTFLVDYIEWGNCLRWLLEAWEEENE